MTKAYFLKSLVWGILFCFLFSYLFYGDFTGNQLIGMIFVFGLSALLFPFARYLTEVIALRYTTREFWMRGLFVETPAKNGLYAIYFLACYILSIPLGIICILLNKTALPRKA